MRDMSGHEPSALLRWRLILGSGADETLKLRDLGGQHLDADAAAGIDRALAFLYDDAAKGASLSDSSPALPEHLAAWLREIRRFFPTDAVTLLQRDAIERKHLRALLFEPETLPQLDRNVELAATLLHYKALIPEHARHAARQVVQEIVDDITARLEPEVRQAILGATRQNRHSVIPVARNIDWPTTIRRNLKHYQPPLKTIVPERIYFRANQVRLHDWTVLLVVDQSGSMGTSLIYASIMAAIFASLAVLHTRLFFFDSAVVDMTPHLDDPVDILFGARLGGGTDIGQAVAHAARYVRNPHKTMLLLITDLYDGGPEGHLLTQLEALVESGVRTLCLLALTDDGNASYHQALAQNVADLGVHTFGCTPRALASALERILKGM